MQYENDERAVARAIEEALAEIDHGTARTIASWFNNGADTVIYAFVSTGAMVGDTFPTDVLMHHLREGVDQATLDGVAGPLEALEVYLKEREDYDDLDRVDGWSDMWVGKHVDYPHATGQLDTCWCSEGDDSERSCGCGGVGVHGVDHEDY